MELTLQLTPEMVGLGWRRVLLLGLRSMAITVLVEALVSRLVYSQFMNSGVLVLGISMFFGPLIARALARTKLRINAEGIEELDGPTIHKDEIALVNEYIAGPRSGIEITGKNRPRWLRRYQIYVPAAMPEYRQVRELVRSWVRPQDWHTCERPGRTNMLSRPWTWR